MISFVTDDCSEPSKTIMSVLSVIVSARCSSANLLIVSPIFEMFTVCLPSLKVLSCISNSGFDGRSSLLKIEVW